MRSTAPRCAWLAVAALAVGGCDADPVDPLDAAPDAAVDAAAGPDLEPEPEPDLAPEPEPRPDAAADLGPPDAAPLDAASPDAAPLDAAPLDAEADAEADAAPDLAPVDAEVDARHEVDPVPDAGVDLDWVEVACDDPTWMPGPCAPGVGVRQENAGAAHIPEDMPIEYAFDPPASGPHRSRWGRWGEYSFLPPQRYLHNLEHGGIALLYHPCADAETVDALRALARERPEDDGGPFRWVLTPYPGLDSAVAVLAWEWVYRAECVQPAEIGAFVDRYYRMAPEDVRGDGAYDRGWLGR